MWDFKPYDNDSAADLLGHLMDKTKLRDEWYAQASTEEGFAAKRALAWLFIQLGHVYVWPIDHYTDDLELAIRLMKKVKQNPEYHEPDLKVRVDSEYETLVSRRR